VVSQAISHYRIIKKLGAGGMGEVYLAEDTRLARKVAIKLLLPKSAGDEQARKRLIREARAAAKLDHPNICAIHEVGEEANASFIVMQYVEGETLAGIIHKRHLELRELLDIAIQILSALSEAHSQGIIHRDIKPQNIIVTSRGQVKVLDFGLAKTVQRDQPVESEAETQSILTEAGVIMGTVGYMSPEQARGAALDARSDLFSLGALLYECVTGRPAFTGNNLIDICAQVIHVDPQPPSNLNPLVPPELDRITLRALAKEADARYQSAGELLEDLRRVRDTSQAERQMTPQPVALEPTTSRVRALTTIFNIVQKRSPLAAAVLIVFLIAILAVWVVPRFWPRTTHQPLPEAKRFYDKGTNDLRDGAYYQASKALEHAISLDDRFALAHARLAEAWTELDYSDRAKDELLRVTALVPDRSALPPLDALYLKAVTSTVTRESAGAVESYDKIVQQVAEPEKPFAYLDLGRAYEKNEEIDHAIESYQEAAKRDGQYAPAFLRLGVLYGRQQDLKIAAEAFDKAESLYQALSNLEGVTEVLYQRGALSNKLGKLVEARALLERALDITGRTANKYQQIRILLQLSHTTCVAGDIPRAQQYATEARDLAQADEMENLTTQGLIDLGYAFLVRNQLERAEDYFLQALEFARRNKGRRNEARALLMLGNLRMQQDNADEARRYVEQALPFYEQGGYRKEASQALYLLGHANDLKGDYSNALEAFKKQLQVAEQWGDQSQVALSHEGIGVTLAHREGYPEALQHFEVCYTTYNALGKQLNAGYSLLNRGDMLWRLGRYEEAEAVLNQALSIAVRPQSDYKQLSGRIYLVKAGMALSQRRFLEAQIMGKQALGILDTQSRLGLVEAMSVFGLAQTLSGEKQKGRLTCGQAAEMAKHTDDPRLVSGTLLALAESMLEIGDFQGAFATASSAEASFASAGQRESEWKAALLAGRAGARLGDHVSANEYESRAENVYSGLQQYWGIEAFASYGTRLDVGSFKRYFTRSFTTAK
jgi:serine/threonine protein kinase